MGRSYLEKVYFKNRKGFQKAKKTFVVDWIKNKEKIFFNSLNS